jgi:hypothetical protein
MFLQYVPKIALTRYTVYFVYVRYVHRQVCLVPTMAIFIFSRDSRLLYNLIGSSSLFVRLVVGEMHAPRLRGLTTERAKHGCGCNSSILYFATLNTRAKSVHHFLLPKQSHRYTPPESAGAPTYGFMRRSRPHAYFLYIQSTTRSNKK